MKKNFSRRFDSEDYLMAWQNCKKFPVIHDRIFFAASRWADNVVGDLCSSTGLLGRRFFDLSGLQVRALEANNKTVELGKKYKVYNKNEVEVVNAVVDDSSLNSLSFWFEGLHTLLARRCLYLIAEKIELRKFAQFVRNSGIKIVALEGLAESINSVHPYGNADIQAEFFADFYECIFSSGDVRVLRYKG